MVFVPPYCSNASTGYTTRRASFTEQQRIQKACQDLDLPLDTIDFPSSRVQNAFGASFETLPDSWALIFKRNKEADTSYNPFSGKLEGGSKRYVPLLVRIDEGDATEDVISNRLAKIKENFANAKYGREDTNRFIFPRYFKVPDTQNEVLALLTNQPERSSIEQLELPSYLEPLLTEENGLGASAKPMRPTH